MQVKVYWLHHFWGDYHATIYAIFPKGFEHVAKKFGKAFFGEKYRVIPEPDGVFKVGIFTDAKQHTEIAAKLSPIRIDSDYCDICNKLHPIGDTAHSIDEAQPITVDIGTVDHPNQKMLWE